MKTNKEEEFRKEVLESLERINKSIKKLNDNTLSDEEGEKVLENFNKKPVFRDGKRILEG